MRDLTRITESIAADMATRATEALHRLSPEGRRLRARARARRRKAMARIARRMFAAFLAILVAAFAWGLFVGPIGLGGIMAAALAVLLSWIAILSLSTPPAPTPAALAASDLPLLPQRTEEWLEKQRPALPAPAVRLVDGIGLKLEALAPQLATLDPREPAAAEIRKLLCDELPELVNGYRRVPEALRRDVRDGTSPDAQLIDGLNVVDGEIARMTAQLASGDLHKLATQGRYLELKYKGDGGLA
ncbi:MAG: hypothetical protein JWM38_724 [Sphingomonas bacterium]|nr:hypothetical protein [Sphingomonas bacterium]